MNAVENRSNLTTLEEELFQLIETKSNNDIRSQDDARAIKKFFTRRLSSPIFNINCLDEYGRTPLMNVVLYFYNMDGVTLSEDEERFEMEVIMILLENGADIHMKTIQDGETAIHIACSFSSSSCVKLLLDHGADPHLRDAAGNTSLLIASRCRKCDNMEVLLRYGVDVNVKNYCGNTPFHEVVCNGFLCWGGVNDGVKLLLEYCFDVNVQNKDGTTPLSMIVIKYREDNDIALAVIQLLLDANTDVNIKIKRAILVNMMMEYTIRGDTALHAAVRYGTIKLIKLLLEYHPDLSIFNEVHHTVLDIARYRKANGIVQLI